MRTTLDIPAELIARVMEITGAKTKSQAIKAALEALVIQEKRKRLLLYQGKLDLSIDLDNLRERK
ncbi:hypothetical protein C900_04862 [Fulvivirga imtechensis AK7]|uniref:Type II toxin-antitoxin system VapB family antitoxin n=1 Tax=Fulvivirga imtechensis AK7 TaxID=1237149 RepID=L8JQI8_9BACT|nr:type II toxin-antitoxin system VapB family antitoxin [Fulvivirga imtechensis]ELR69637.1 hypothetical protein C900_04862 [Fulvivirga imtechensis AK7]